MQLYLLEHVPHELSQLSHVFNVELKYYEPEQLAAHENVYVSSLLTTNRVALHLTQVFAVPRQSLQAQLHVLRHNPVV